MSTLVMLHPRCHAGPPAALHAWACTHPLPIFAPHKRLQVPVYDLQHHPTNQPLIFARAAALPSTSARPAAFAALKPTGSP